MSVCPVCNSLIVIQKNCSNCGEQMVDAGKIQDYYDDYSPYLAQDIYQDGYDGNDSDHCVHLFACPSCHHDTRLTFRKEEGQHLTDYSENNI